ncbi:MAG: hypothetical protein M0P57_05165 [Syntrophales bacterium]|jgi:DNA polymerase-3 subunit delta|nr:hypothetical protein [Syntrophales bacterium]MDY0044603.1 hypothetical protein [Syntrophales bacterium]
MIHTIKDVLVSVEKGIIPPCILIYGDESHKVKSALDQIIETIYPSGAPELNLFYINGEQEEEERICEAVLTPPLIPGRKLVVVRNTNLLASRAPVSNIFAEFREKLNQDRNSAARSFLRFVDAAGWNYDEILEGGWKKITDAEWHMLAGEKENIRKEEIFPKMIDICQELNITKIPPSKETAHLESILSDSMSGTVTLILTASAADKRKKLFKIISDTGFILHYPKAAQESKQKQLASEAARNFLAPRGKTISPDAFAELGERSGYTYEDTLGALEKLVTYIGKQRSRIEKADVEEVVGLTKENKVFVLTAALAEKDVEKSIQALKRLLEQDIHHLMIFAMVVREIRLLIQGKSLLESGIIPNVPPSSFSEFKTRIYPVIKNESDRRGKGKILLFGQHPFVIFQLLKHSQKFTWKEIMKDMDTLVEADIILKSSGTSPELILERLIIEICKND